MVNWFESTIMNKVLKNNLEGSKTGVSNSNPLTGLISHQKCSAGHTL